MSSELLAGITDVAGALGTDDINIENDLDALVRCPS
jgi:hypothetical protein